MESSIGSKIVNLASRAHSSLYRATKGRMGGNMLGTSVLLLNTVGRKSGKPRTTPLLYLADGDDLVIVASYGGAPKHPAWWLNLKARPETTVEVGDRRLRVRAEEASPEEKGRLWPKLVEMYPSYADYQKKTDRQIPVIVLHPIG